MLELYNEKVRDLIRGDGEPLSMKQDKNKVFYVKDLSAEEVKSEKVRITSYFFKGMHGLSREWN